MRETLRLPSKNSDHIFVNLILITVPTAEKAENYISLLQPIAYDIQNKEGILYGCTLLLIPRVKTQCPQRIVIKCFQL